MTERLNAIVGAKISEFRRKMAEVKKIAKTVPNKIFVEVEARVNKFQQTMNRVSNFIHSFDNIMANAFAGSLMMVSPAAVPLIAVLVGLLGTLGPMMGVIGGSTFALASAFGFVGAAAVAFGAAAIPSIMGVFGETEKLTKAQKAARAEYTKFQKTWQGIVKDLEKPVLEAFGKSMQFANRVLKMARPLFDSAATAVNNLLDSLNMSLESSPVKAFFDYMNKNAGPMLETLGKAGGNFIQGFMSMMTAFGPLAGKTAQGFLDMSKGFADWAAGLSKSEKFQTFVDYINENMPKIRAIFRDALSGIVYFFAAFGPLSSDMLTSLQNMMGRFKEWASTLGENQQFQKFVGYIRENAPKAMELIGNLTNFLVNLGIGLAPLGSKILDIVNGFLSWTNGMMETHPWIGQMIGVILLLAGGFRALLPIIIAGRTLFAGFGTTLTGTIGKIKPIFNAFKTNMLAGLKLLGKTVASTAARFASQLALMGSKAAMWGSMVLAQLKKTAARWATSLAKMVAKGAVWAAKALFHAGRVAASWVIAMGPVGWVIAIIIALVALIIANWDKVKSWTLKTFSKIASYMREKMDEGKQKVKSILDKIKGFFDGINLYESGKAIIQSAIDGLNAMKGKILGVVDNIVGAVRDFWPFSPAKRGPLSDIHRMDFKGPIATSINKAKSGVARAMSGLAGTARTAFQPKQMQFAYDAALTSSDLGRIQHQFSAEINDFELPERDIIIVMDGKEVGRGVEKYVTEQQVGKRERRLRFKK